jgi:replicative DNA helicase
MLSNLRESGSIEQDADQVLLLYRSDYYTNGRSKGQRQERVGASDRNKYGRQRSSNKLRPPPRLILTAPKAPEFEDKSGNPSVMKILRRQKPQWSDRRLLADLLEELFPFR